MKSEFKPKTNIAEMKKLDNGKMAVRWEGTKKFVIVDDDIVAQFIIYRMTTDDTHTTSRAHLVSQS